MSGRSARISEIGMLLCAVGLIAALCARSPKHPQRTRFGDDVEYLLGAQSFVRHWTPEYRPGDEADVLASLPHSWQGSAALKYKPQPSGYFPDKTGTLYSWHFFTYAAAVAPLKAALDRYGFGWHAFHYTNIAFFCIALLTLLQLRRSPRQWLVLLPLAFFTPALWFIPFAHTEAFVFALGVIAAACWLADRPLWALLFNSIAATQFQPLALLSVAFAIAMLAGLRDGRPLREVLRAHWARIATCLVLTALAFSPNAFYFWHFGTPSLVTREGYASGRLMSFDKLASLFVDLDTGMLVYLPGVLLVWIWSVCSAVRTAVRERSVVPLWLPVTVVLVLYASTSARIWNYHTQGVARYAVYCAPAMLLGIGLQLKAATKPGWLVPALVVIGLGLQSGVHAEFGWFGYRGNDNLHHNPVALYVLERWPALYSSPPEIFCSRTLHKRCWIDLETGQIEREYLPVLLLDEHWSAIKGFLFPCEAEALIARFPLFHESQRQQLRAAKRKCEQTGDRAPQYVNLR